jgi:hypothetical protein
MCTVGMGVAFCELSIDISEFVTYIFMMMFRVFQNVLL